jgi:hypothetical protein
MRSSLFLAVALVAIVGCASLDVTPIDDPITALEVEGSSGGPPDDETPAKTPATTAIADNNSEDRFASQLDPAMEPAVTPDDVRKLKATLDSRKTKRLEAEIDQTKENAERMSVEYAVDEDREKKALQHMTNLLDKEAKFKSEGDAATADVKQLEQKLSELHQQGGGMEADLEMAKHNTALSKGMIRASVIEEELTAADMNASDGSETKDDAQADTARREFNKGLNDWATTEGSNAMKTLAARQQAADAASAKVEAMHLSYHNLNKAIGIADRRKGGARYEIKHLQKEINDATERVAQTEAITKTSKKNMEVAKKLVTSATQRLARNRAGGREELIAEAMDPEIAKVAAVKSALDHHGLSDSGKELISKPGKISRKYMQLFQKYKDPEPNNPLLDATARAAVKTPALPSDADAAELSP